MTCDRCGKEIGKPECPIEYKDVYQVRIGEVDEENNFIPDEDSGYYCSDCLAKGV